MKDIIDLKNMFLNLMIVFDDFFYSSYIHEKCFVDQEEQMVIHSLLCFIALWFAKI